MISAERGPRNGAPLVLLMRIISPSMTFERRDFLVVEDAPDVLAVFTMLLESEGATVRGAASGHEALALVRSHHFDVVVTDLGLPDIAGDVLIRRIIATARRPITVVVITGERGPAVTRALEAGAAVIFAKPCYWALVVTYLGRLALAPVA